MSRNIDWGGSYPPGCSGTPYDEQEFCDCGRAVDPDCVCIECNEGYCRNCWASVTEFCWKCVEEAADASKPD